MKRVFFNSNNDYKPSSKHISDPEFIPLAIINDIKAQKNGTKKTVFWVKKRKKEEDGTIKGEKWQTTQQYIGDWKENKKHGYGIKIYDNKDKYEGYWENDLRNGKGTYWLNIGKNKFRKLYTGDWKNNKKEGHGIYFYKDGSCYDGEWKNSKRDGKGLMIYANQDIYEGHWSENLRHGYGILEKQNGDKFYGYWYKDKKEGQGYYYYHSTSKIYLGEWHEGNPRCGIFTDVDDETMKIDESKIPDFRDVPAQMPVLKLEKPAEVLEESINNVHFIRNIKAVKSKNLQELFSSEEQKKIIKMYAQLRQSTNRNNDDENENQIPNYTISIKELKGIIRDNAAYDLTDEVLELIFYALGMTLYQDTQVDFLLFVKIYYLIVQKEQGDEEEEEDIKEGQEELNEVEGDEEEGIENEMGEHGEEMEEEAEGGEEYEEEEELTHKSGLNENVEETYFL